MKLAAGSNKAMNVNTFSGRISLQGSHQANWPAVRSILPAGLNHLRV